MTMTVNGVCRYTIHGHWSNGHTIDNVFDFKIDTTGSIETRLDSVQNGAIDIIQNWQSQVMPWVSDNYVVTGITWVDLDQEDGSTGERPPDSGEILAGGTTAAACDPSRCYLFTKTGSSRRGERTGRTYVAGVTESSIDENGVISTATDNVGFLIKAGMTAFLENTTEGVTPWFNVEDRRMVVVHLPPRPVKPLPDNRVGTYSAVQAMNLDPVVATQRRRLR